MRQRSDAEKAASRKAFVEAERGIRETMTARRVQRETDLMAAAFLAGYCTEREGESTVETIERIEAEFRKWLAAGLPTP